MARAPAGIDRSTVPGRFGAWAFRQRSWLPVPAALVLVVLHQGETRATWPLFVGPSLVVTGQTLRLWAVRHIGIISRTRTTRFGPFVTDGPYAVLRNPLYVGNWLLWTGFAVWSGLLWMLPIAWGIFVLQYGAITRWEEERLRLHFGSAYDTYAGNVPRWRPRWMALHRALSTSASHPWRDVIFSERGTLLAVGVMSLLLVLKKI
jgi:protein-S-isoprenylcysteine O-methyltransferase Ste14